MKLNQISSKEIEALKGKCKGCSGTGEQLGMIGKTSDSMICAMQTCEVCLGNGKASIEIEKEYKKCPDCDGKKYHELYNQVTHCDCKTGKIPKYNGDEIEIPCHRCFENELTVHSHKLKIISETDKTWRVVMVK